MLSGGSKPGSKFVVVAGVWLEENRQGTRSLAVRQVV